MLATVVVLLVWSAVGGALALHFTQNKLDVRSWAACLALSFLLGPAVWLFLTAAWVFFVVDDYKGSR